MDFLDWDFGFDKVEFMEEEDGELGFYENFEFQDFQSSVEQEPSHPYHEKPCPVMKSPIVSLSSPKSREEVYPNVLPRLIPSPLSPPNVLPRLILQPIQKLWMFRDAFEVLKKYWIENLPPKYLILNSIDASFYIYQKATYLSFKKYMFAYTKNKNIKFRWRNVMNFMRWWYCQKIGSVVKNNQQIPEFYIYSGRILDTELLRGLIPMSKDMRHYYDGKKVLFNIGYSKFEKINLCRSLSSYADKPEIRLHKFFYVEGEKLKSEYFSDVTKKRQIVLICAIVKW